MKKTAIPIILCILFFADGDYAIGQTCSNDALTAKYWQYRKTFNDHFIVIDRKPEGCIGNGLTDIEAEIDLINCGTSFSHGLSLPATGISMSPNGANALTENGRLYNADHTPSVFMDAACQGTHINPSTNLPLDNISWDNAIHNEIEFGVETPHQLGWYLTVLATEYELLKRNEKYAEAQRTLEEIFLALQAYRRLDITANCLVKQRYDEIQAGFETESCIIQVGLQHKSGSCLCPEIYNIGPCSDGEEHFDIPCKETCAWEPDLSGYSGFFIREDAVQSLESLHDDSEDRWNIDMVNSSYVMSQSPPCTTTFSQPCYMLSQGRFLSSDQMFAIMMGLAMVKRFVPESATVTTCDGSEYHPLEIARNIAEGMVEIPHNATRHLFWPGSDDPDCCWKPVKFGECNGGNFQWTYAGIVYMHNYINPDHKHLVTGWDRAKWNAAMPSSIVSNNANYALEAMTFASDWGNMNNINRILLRSSSRIREKEIFLLMNDVVFPEYPHNANEQEDLEMFKQMLCEAPCGGPCVKPFEYDNHDSTWPAFECSNTPGWTGQRWEGGPHSSIDWDPTETYKARQFNGLDYMALYNLYMLRYPNEQTPFTDPASFHDGDHHLLGESQINGPSYLCPYASGTYTIKPSYASSVIEALTWKPSSHFTLSTTNLNPTEATFAFPGAQGYPIISAEFNEARQIPQWNPTEPGYVLEISIGDFATDVCQMQYAKHIDQATIPYSISAELDHCANDYWFHAIGPPALSYSWEITAVADNPNLQPVMVVGNGQNLNIIHPLPRFPGDKGTLTIDLSVWTTCGWSYATFTVPYKCLHTGYNVRVDPNPANTAVSVNITKNDLSPYSITDPNGVPVRITPASGGIGAINTRIYNNGQTIPVSSLPNGVYSVYATPSDVGEQLSTTLVIMR